MMQPCRIQNFSSEQAQQLGDPTFTWWRLLGEHFRVAYLSLLCWAGWVGAVAEDVPDETRLGRVAGLNKLFMWSRSGSVISHLAALLTCLGLTGAGAVA